MIRRLPPVLPATAVTKVATALLPEDYPLPRQRPAARAPADESLKPALADVPPPVPVTTAPQPGAAREAEPAPKPKQQRGHARRNDDGKFEPTGDYETGFARPPIEHRFDGSQKSPGRPKGLRSQESYLREALDETLGLSENGVHRKVKKRQVAAKLFVKAALENPAKAVMVKLLAEAQRLYPEQASSKAAKSPLGDAGLDAMVIAQFLAGLALGEPNPDNGSAGDSDADDPAASATSDEAWGEGDWNAPGAPENQDNNDDDDGPDYDPEEDSND